MDGRVGVHCEPDAYVLGLARKAFANGVTVGGKRYDVTIIDAPPLLPVTDAAVMASQTDGAVLVRPDGYVAWRGRSGASRPREVLRAVVDGVLARIPQPALSAE